MKSVYGCTEIKFADRKYSQLRVHEPFLDFGEERPLDLLYHLLQIGREDLFLNIRHTTCHEYNYDGGTSCSHQTMTPYTDY